MGCFLLDFFWSNLDPRHLKTYVRTYFELFWNYVNLWWLQGCLSTFQKPDNFRKSKISRKWCVDSSIFGLALAYNYEIGQLGGGGGGVDTLMRVRWYCYCSTLHVIKSLLEEEEIVKMDLLGFNIALVVCLNAIFYCVNAKISCRNHVNDDVDW